MSVQRLEIRDWLPAQLANGSHGHWSQRYKKLQAAQMMVWAYARHARWTPVHGRARLTVTLVFKVKRRRDRDGLYARVKGCVDGLVRGKFIEDDNMDVLDLRVLAEVSRDWSGTRLELEALECRA